PSIGLCFGTLMRASLGVGLWPVPSIALASDGPVSHVGLMIGIWHACSSALLA
ncbi:unnamed protein product, partial [Dovyalis caffra]